VNYFVTLEVLTGILKVPSLNLGPGNSSTLLVTILHGLRNHCIKRQFLSKLYSVNNVWPYIK